MSTSRLSVSAFAVGGDLQGEHYQLPLPDGQGKPLKLTIAPISERIPIYLAAVGPKNLELAGELADGWLAIFYARTSRPSSSSGFGPAGRGSARASTASTSFRASRWW